MKKFILWFSVIMIASLLLYFAICSFTYSEGSRSGMLLKFSRKGYVFKTYEGELNSGILNNSSLGLTASMWYFSVPGAESSVINKLNQLEGKHVKLTYKQKIKALPWQGETRNFVTDVEEIK